MRSRGGTYMFELWTNYIWPLIVIVAQRLLLVVLLIITPMLISALNRVGNTYRPLALHIPWRGGSGASASSPATNPLEGLS